MSQTVKDAYEAGTLDAANICCNFLNKHGYEDACAAFVAHWNQLADPVAKDADGAKQQRAQAQMQGYTGDACSECGNMTMVRNGTCLKCQTCGSTTGCS
ncbi:hypothetical protein [Maritalea porphyrae]|uniref:hypothetical protein n=1 Tax=Maritalea porphyrae TaxID=880732 RepID=UPI0022AEA8C1|nr:hypothetical protein [Maritalea porphyrae]MCZ4270758.1 hypothetical protein [Maritalea porphyrae]